MQRLDNGNYLVPAIRASEAIEYVRSQVSDRIRSIVAIQLPGPNGLWLVQPHYFSAEPQPTDSQVADRQWIGQVIPVGWIVNVETQSGLLIIRNQSRSLSYVKAMIGDVLLRGELRRAFAQLAVQI